MHEESDAASEIGHILLKQEVAHLRDDVAKLTKDVEGLVDAWKTANGVVAFVKWLAGLAAALSALWAVFRLKIGA